jgi:hypothetical protein
MEQDVQEKSNRIIYNPSRPQLTYELKYQVALKLLKDNPQYFAIAGDNVINQLVNCIKNKNSLQEEHAWFTDEELRDQFNEPPLEISNNYRKKLKEELRKQENDWVIANSISPPFPIGTTVCFSYDGGSNTGRISGIDKDEPAYYVISLNPDDCVSIPFEDCWVLEKEYLNDKSLTNYSDNESISTKLSTYNMG